MTPKTARPKASQADEQFRAALAFAQSGDAPRAMRLLDRTLSLDARHRGVRNALGVLRLESGDAVGAIALLTPLARELPDASAIQVNLGNALVAAGRASEAVAPLKRAASLDRSSVPAWYGYARALQTAGRVVEAEAAYRAVLQLAPTHVESRANLAAVCNFLDRYVEAEAEAREVVRLAPDHAGAHVNLAVALLAQQKWATGWAEYEWRERTSLLDGQRQLWERPRWAGESVQEKRVLVHAEQGYGDTMQFVRYLPALASLGARVLLQCPSSLVDVLRFASLAHEVIATGSPLPEYDVHVPLTSLPHLLPCTTDADVYVRPSAYLSPLPASERPAPPSIAQLQDPTALRVGIVWAGSATHVNDMHRSCALGALLPLLALPGVTWFSLQNGPRASDLAGLPCDVVVHDVSGELRDFADTAAAIAALDLVVSVDSAVAHLTGALGRPCLLLAPRIGLDWRWVGAGGDGSDSAVAAGEGHGCRPASAWYGSVRVLRQKEEGDWSGPVSQARVLIEKLRVRQTLG